MHLFVIGMDMFVQNTTLFNFHIHRLLASYLPSSTEVDLNGRNAGYLRHRESTHHHSHD